MRSLSILVFETFLFLFLQYKKGFRDIRVFVTGTPYAELPAMYADIR